MIKKLIEDTLTLTFELFANDIDNTSDEISYEVVNDGADISIILI